jgi:hypothetical protein
MDIENHPPKEVRMFFRFRNSLGLALLLSLMTSITVFAKGGFSFITVTGADLKEAVRISDPALTMSFFAFANFFEDRTEAPSNPGTGYEITRFYLDGKREIAFDLLHYYPESGFVFYDGIINGESEYDDEWYIADPKIADVFVDALSLQTQAAENSLKLQTTKLTGRIGEPPSQGQAVTGILVIVSLTAVVVLAYRSRKPSAR